MIQDIPVFRDDPPGGKVFLVGGLNRLTAAAHEALLHHEWYGHGIMDYGDATKDHNKAYGLHSKNYPLWLKSTIKFKLDTISKELQYIYLETTKP